MRLSLGGTPVCNVWVLVLGVLAVVGQHTHLQFDLQRQGDSDRRSNSLASNNNREQQQQQQKQQRSHSSHKSHNSNNKHSETFIKTFETSLLKMFGMKSRPKSARKTQIPQYMIELFHEHTQNPDSVDFHVKGINTHSANTARSFYHQDEGSISVSQDDHNHVRFVFNISSVPDTETLTASELRIYRHSANQTDISPHLKTELMKQRHRIDIYEVLRLASRTREAITRLVDTRIVSPQKHSRWESFDIHPAVLKWRQSPHLNFGLEVRVTNLAGQRTKLQHVRLKRSVQVDAKQWLAEQPFLVTYTDDGRQSSQRTRRRRSSRHRKRSKGHHYSRKKKQQQCKRHELYVDFSDVGWDDWIVAPPGYQAFYCHGECDLFPLPEYINTTNHAIVQSLVHSVNPKAVPLPCCVPTELSHISMLYLDEYQKVVLKKYEDMVVEGCGCR